MPVPYSRLRPLDIGSLIDETLTLYRTNWKTFLTICAIVLIPTGFLQLVLTLMLHASTDTEDVGQLFAAAIGALPLALITGIGFLMLGSAMIYATSAAWHSEPIGVNDAFDRRFTKLGWLFLSVALGGIAIGAMSLTIVGIPIAVYFGISWAFANAILLLENAGVTESLGRSRQLIKGNWWRVLGIFILMGIIQWIISALFTLPGTILGAGAVVTGGTADDIPAYARVVSQIGSTAGQIISYPIAACAYILLYYDLRIRKEGSNRPITTGQHDPPTMRVDRTF